MSQNFKCFPIVNGNNIETFVNEEILIPVQDDMVELNKFFLEAALDDACSDAQINIPRDVGNYANNLNPESHPMKLLTPQSLKPILVQLPNNVKADAPIILLDKPLDDNNAKIIKKSPEEIVSPALLSHVQNINHISVENGLRPVPILSDPQGMKLKSKNSMEFDNPSPIVVELPFKLPLQEVSEETPLNYKSGLLKVSTGGKRKTFKKFIMYLCIALVIYLAYLLLSKK
jgi:hypothetical protein